MSGRVGMVTGSGLPQVQGHRLVEQAHPIPMLLGSNREEAALFLAPDVLPGDPYPTSSWVRDTSAVVGPQNSVKARALYPLSAYDSAFWSTMGLTTDSVYTCPMRQLALANLASQGTVYRYVFTHRYDNDPLLASFRSAHFLDEPLLWHDSTLASNYIGAPSYTFSPGEEALSARMSGYWTNFAKSGNPNGTGLPNWPRFTIATELSTVLDQPAAQVSQYQTKKCAFLDSLPPPFERLRDHAPRRWRAR